MSVFTETTNATYSTEGIETSTCNRANCSYSTTRSIGKQIMIYLKPNANWKKDNARFAAYFFGNGEKWISMEDTDNDGIYECSVPSGYPNVIFCRMTPSNSTNNWNNKWNQTSDLTVPKNSDSTNCYTVSEGAWDKGKGSWSELTKYTTIYFKPNSTWLTKSNRFAAYIWKDDNANTWVDLTDLDGDGIYECKVQSGCKKIIFCCMNASTPINDWTKVHYQTVDISLSSTYNMYTITSTSGTKYSGSWSKKS
jgi:hypothetical protein